MSKNLVDAVVELSRSDIAFLPSRRQIDYDGGYVGWNTKDFAKYVQNKILIERDHGGAGQGKNADDGKISYEEDVNYMDIIHVDPWKNSSSIEEAFKKTVDDILYINSLNPSVKFEVGTEQAIFPVSTENLLSFLHYLKNTLPEDVFNNIEYVVIQSGVDLDVVNETNTGTFSKEKLLKEIEICKIFGKKTKEHNGDFLSKEQRNVRFDSGLHAINIGPELSIFENKCYMKHMSIEDLKKANEICFESQLWKKWILPHHDLNDFGIFFKICGHYNYKKIQLPNINIKELLKEKILSIVE